MYLGLRREKVGLRQKVIFEPGFVCMVFASDVDDNDVRLQDLG